MSKFNNVLAFGLVVGGVILEMKVIKKLDDIHKEIIYFEEKKGIYCDRKTYDKRFKEYWEDREEA